MKEKNDDNRKPHWVVDSHCVVCGSPIFVLMQPVLQPSILGADKEPYSVSVIAAPEATHTCDCRVTK